MKEEFVKVCLKKGQKYKLCTCSESKSLPYCDNEHQEYNKKHKTNFRSFKLIPEEDTEINVWSGNWAKNESRKSN